MNNLSGQNKKYGVFRKISGSVFRIPYLFLLLMIFMNGCVRLTGTAGYWKTGTDGETATKRASFDTADYVPGSPTPGSITI